MIRVRTGFLFFILLMSVWMIGCGGGKNRQQLIEAYNEASTEYAKAAQAIENQGDGMDNYTYRLFLEIGNTLKAYRTKISTQSSFTKDETTKMAEWLDNCKDWAREVKKLWGTEYD